MTSAPLRLVQTALPHPAALEKRWRELEGRAQGSFFTSWTWIGSWLRSTGARPALISVTDSAGQEIGLTLIGTGKEKVLLGEVPVLRLNEACETDADRVFIEYNRPLAAEGREEEVEAALAEWLGHRRDWRLLRLSGVAPDCLLVGAIAARRRILIDVSPSYYVDLAAVRDAKGDYLSLLSSNTRSQIRRSEKDYDAPASGVARAYDVEEVDAWLEEMAKLNVGRHADNAWELPLFRSFAREIVLAGFETGTVDLLRISRGGPIGYLINFIHAGRALNYQSAFAEPVSAKAKPGLMSHTAAVLYYAQSGLNLYSLLAGKDRYKESLATGAEELHWWRLERFDPRLEAEYWLRRWLKR